MHIQFSRITVRNVLLILGMLVAAAYVGIGLILPQRPKPEINVQPVSTIGSVQVSSSTILKWLTSSKWKVVNSRGPFSEGYEYQFSKAGTFIWTLISDHVESRKGIWNYEQLSDNTGLIFLLGQNAQFEILYFSFTDPTHLKLAGDTVTAEDNGSLANAGSDILKSTFQNIIDSEHFDMYFNIVANSWRKTSQIDDEFIPDAYVFRRDGTFMASYRNSQCSHQGHWSMKSNSVILEMPVQRDPA